MREQLFLRYWSSHRKIPEHLASLIDVADTHSDPDEVQEEGDGTEGDDHPDAVLAEAAMGIVVEWVLYSEEVCLGGPDQCRLVDLMDQLPASVKPAQLDVVVLLPGESVTMTSVVPPSKQLKHLLRALPFMLEEQLTEDPEALHYALGEKTVDESGVAHVPVAVVSKPMLERCLDQLKQYQLSPSLVVPDFLLLPLSEASADDGKVSQGHPKEGGGASWSLALEDERMLIRLGAAAGHSVSLSQADFFVGALLNSRGEQGLTGSRGENRKGSPAEGDRLSVTVDITAEVYEAHEHGYELSSGAGSAKEALLARWRGAGVLHIDQSIDFKISTKKANLPLFLQLCQHYRQQQRRSPSAKGGFGRILKPLNLLQGAYKQRSRKKVSRFRWRPAAAIAAIWLMLQVTFYISEAAWYSAEAERLEETSRQLFKEINPNAKRIINVKKQLQSQLKQAGGAKGVDFLKLLEQTGEPIAKLNGRSSGRSAPKVELNRLYYDESQKQLRIDLYVTGYPILDKLKLALEERGLRVEIDGASQDKDRVKVKMKVKG